MGLKKLFNRKGQLGALAPSAIALMTLGIIVSIAFIILGNFRDTQESAIAGNTLGCAGNTTNNTDAFNSICNLTSALSDNLVGNFGIIVIVVVFAVILGLIAFFRTVSE